MSAAESGASDTTRRRFLRWSVIGAGLAVALAYLTALGYLKANEVQFIFVPNRTAHPVANEVTGHIERVPRVTASGAPGLLWVMREPDRRAAPWVLYLHGNGANLSTPVNVERYAQLRRLGVNVVAVEYPGFGELPGTPSEAALGLAARDAWTWLRDAGVPPSAIAIYGWSLGSGVATELAAAVDERATVLEGAFSGIDDRASEIYPWLPIRLLVRHRFASRERIARIGSPLLLIHAADDTIVPIEHARALLALAREPRRLVELTGGHVHLNRQDPTRYVSALRTFFDEVFASRATAGM